MTKQSIHVAMCGGGSGGHISPGIAIATELCCAFPNTRCTFVTSARPVDAQILQSAALPERSVTHFPLPITRVGNRLKYLRQVCGATISCIRMFREQRPAVVIGTGGFASVPGILAAWRLGIPVAVVEQNVIPGRANRFLSRFAAVTFTGWPLNAEFKKRWKSEIREVGVPLRKQFGEVAKPAKESASDRTVILIIGGSQGAHAVNRMVKQLFISNPQLVESCHTIHQTGQEDSDAVRECYDQFSTAWQVVPFINNLADRIHESDLIISRAGAATLAEISAIGRPSILIPLSSAADNHQLANAKIFEDAGAATIVAEEASNAVKNLETAVQQYILSPESGNAAALQAKRLARLDAVDKIVQWIVENAGANES